MKTDNIRDSITIGVPSVDFSKSGSMTKDGSPASDSRVARAKASLIGANFFVETNRFEPLMAVYLIGKFQAHTRRHVQKMLNAPSQRRSAPSLEFKNWDVVWVGYVSIIMNILMLVLQTPAGGWEHY